MSKVRVFVSYSRKDSAIMMAIVNTLPNFGLIEVKYDVQDIDSGDPIHKELSNMINWADIVVPIITEDWLSSHETRDELVRAHERRKKIIPIVDDAYDNDANDNNKNKKIPHFLQDGNQIRYSPQTLEVAIEKLSKAIINYKDKKWRQKIFHDIRSMGDDVVRKRKSLLYQEAYATRIVKQAKEELRNILADGLFEIEIGLEKNFLNRAIPIFDASNKIFAISIADISNFWVDQKNNELAYDYIRRQSKKEVYRLFVFSSPQQVVSYKNVIQANYESYGIKKGGVYLCALDTYNKFILSIAAKGKFHRDIYHEDFGVLVFEREEGDEYVEAILDEYALKFRSFDPTEVTYSARIQFMRTMEDLSLIDEGSFGSEFNIYRWCHNTYEDNDVFSDCLSELFQEDEGNVFHYVFIKGDEEVGNVLQELRIRFCSQKEDLRILKASVYKTTNVVAFDGNYGGKLNVGLRDFEPFDYVFFVEFENSEALKHYYNHPIHSVEREILYKEIEPSVTLLYEEARKIQRTKGKSCREAGDVYQKIEKIMEKFIFRLDAFRKMPFSHMVKMPGITIGKYNK